MQNFPIDNVIVNFVKQYEGFSPTVYLDAVGYPTIGYGHKIVPPEQFTYLNEEQATQLLIQDIRKRQLLMLPMIKVEIDQLMQDALLDFCYNLGVWSFHASTLRRLINQGSFYPAADQFGRWVYAGGVKLPGLITRRAAEKQLYLKGWMN